MSFGFEENLETIWGFIARRSAVMHFSYATYTRRRVLHGEMCNLCGCSVIKLMFRPPELCQKDELCRKNVLFLYRIDSRFRRAVCQGPEFPDQLQRAECAHAIFFPQRPRVCALRRKTKRKVQLTKRIRVHNTNNVHTLISKKPFVTRLNS